MSSSKTFVNPYKRNIEAAYKLVTEGEVILNKLEKEGYKIPDSYRAKIKKVKEIYFDKHRTGISKDTLDNIRYLFNIRTLTARIKKIDRDEKNETRKRIETERNRIRAEIKAQKAIEVAKLKSAKDAQKIADKQYRESLTSEAARLRQLGRDMKELERSYDDLRTKKFGPNAGPDNSITGVAIDTYDKAIANNPDLDLSTITQKKLREIYEDPDKTNTLYRLTDFVKTAKEHLPLTAMKFRTKSMKEFKNQVLAKWGTMAHYKTLKSQGWTDDEISKLENFIDSSSLWQGIRSQGYESETEVNIQQSDGSIRTFIAHKGRTDIKDFLGELRKVIQTGTDDDIENFIINRLRN